MRPLSVITYYSRNKVKLAPIFAVLALAVFGISLTGVLTGTIRDAGMYRVQVFSKMGQISPSFRNGINSLDPTIVAELRRDPHVEGLVPTIRLSTYYPTLSGDTSTYIYAFDTELYPLVMARTGLQLAAGRLPRAGTDEVAVHELVSKARGLGIGDAFDPEKDEQEFLSGKLEIVGILRGETVLSLASREYVERRSEFNGYARSLLAFAAPSDQAMLESDLGALDTAKVTAYTFSSEYQHFTQNYGTIDPIVWAINSVVVIVLSLLVGLLNMIYFLDRMNEFGLLLGIGYPRGFVIRRALTESLLLTIAAWAFGVLFSQWIYTLLNQFIFEPRGMILSVLNWHALQFTVPIPIIVGLFAAGTVTWQLRRLDPLSIIERRD